MRYLLVVGLTLFLFSCDSSLTQKPKLSSGEIELLKMAKENFKPLPYSLINKWDEEDKIHLGEKLYFEKKLSINNTISCNSCHKIDSHGVDNEPTSPGHDGTRGERNSPTVYNAALNFAQFWDGRAKDVEEQALGPILNPIEHGLASESDALKKIDTKEYRYLFDKAFPHEKNNFNYKNIGRAIGSFEKTLLTQSRFDDYLRGSMFALSVPEKIGLKKFIEVGCTSCHNGVNIGGEMYMKLGQVKDFQTKDLGRFSITNDEDDKFVFKVPGLRNIVHTYPYMHDGKVENLDEMIRIMGEYQLGENLSSQDIYYIKSFLGSLSAK